MDHDLLRVPSGGTTLGSRYLHWAFVGMPNGRDGLKSYCLLRRQHPAETSSSERWLLPRSELSKDGEALPPKSRRSCWAQKTRATIKDSVLTCKSWMQFHKGKRYIPLCSHKIGKTLPVLWFFCAWVGEREKETFLFSFLCCMLNYKQNANPTLQGWHEITLFFPNNIGHSSDIRRNMW